MTGTNGQAQDEAAHRPFRSWALQHDLISLLGGSADWRVQPAELGLETDAADDPVSAFKGQGHLRDALSPNPRLGLRTRTSVTLWAAALATDVLNQISPIGLEMPTGPFFLTIALVASAMIFTIIVYPRLSLDRFVVVEQCLLTGAGLLIVYQCSVTGGADSPYLMWFLLTSYYAAYLLPTTQGLLNVASFTALTLATLLLEETNASDTTILQMVAVLVVIWSLTRALIRQRHGEETLERAVTFMALADPLTSTANTRSFEQYLEDLSRTDGQRFAIIVADLNGLKGANAVFGHEVGDGMVVRTARLLLRASRENDQVARFGGDEFAVVIPGGREGDVTRWRKEFERSVERHNASVRGRLPQISVALGSAIYPEDGVTPRDLIDAADMRMYESKTSAVAPPYEIEGVTVSDTGRAFRSARFANAPRNAVDARDRARFASLNWLATGSLVLAGAAIGGPNMLRLPAVIIGVYALFFAAWNELYTRRRLSARVAWILDVSALAYGLPLTWFLGGANSPLLVTMTLSVAFYAQNFRPSIALPRVGIVLASFSIGFWAFGSHGPVEDTRYFTCMAAMVVIAGIMQYSARAQASALSTIRSSAVVDQLTGLPNIYALRNDLTDALRSHSADPNEQSVIALIVLDLDEFRLANNVAGHRGGDEVLISVSERLSEIAGYSQAYRVGGDEFAVIVNGLTGRALASFAERCARGIEHDHPLGHKHVEVRASVGYASTTGEISGDELMDIAEDSLRQNKSERRGAEPPPRSVLL